MLFGESEPLSAFAGPVVTDHLDVSPCCCFSLPASPQVSSNRGAIVRCLCLAASWSLRQLPAGSVCTPPMSCVRSPTVAAALTRCTGPLCQQRLDLPSRPSSVTPLLPSHAAGSPPRPQQQQAPQPSQPSTPCAWSHTVMMMTLLLHPGNSSSNT